MKSKSPFIVGLALTTACLLACTDDAGADTSGSEDTSETGGTHESEGTPGTCRTYPTTNALADVFVRNGAAGADACELDIAPCGGQPAGVWTLASSCGPELVTPGNPFEMYCPGATYTPSAVRKVGVLAVSVAGEWELEVSSVVDFTYGADITCLGVFDCGPEAEAAFTTNGGSATCSGQVSACSCTVTDFPFETTQQTGSLGTGGATLDPDGNANPLPYCIEGDSLSLWTLMGSASSSGDMCEGDDDCSTDATQVGVCVPS